MTTPAPEEPQRPARAAPFFPTPSVASEQPDPVAQARRRIVRVGVAILVLGFLSALVGAILLGQGRGPQEAAGESFHQFGKVALLLGLLTLLIGFRWQPATYRVRYYSGDSSTAGDRLASIHDLLDELGPAPRGAEEGPPLGLPGAAPSRVSASVTELAGERILQFGKNHTWREQRIPVAAKILIATMVVAATGCTWMAFLRWLPWEWEFHLFVLLATLLLASSYGMYAYFARREHRVFAWTAAVVSLLFVGAELELAVTYMQSWIFVLAVPLTLGVWLVPPITGSFVSFLWKMIGAMLERMLKRK